MRLGWCWCVGLLLLTEPGWAAGTARIMKVLPHLLDEEGRHTAAPSLYERDAHQTMLRRQPERVTGLRFDVHWKCTAMVMETLRLRMEVRGSKDPQVNRFEQAVERRRWYQRWTAVVIDRATYERLGEVVAWRATLWDGDRLLAEHQSFLW